MKIHDAITILTALPTAWRMQATETRQEADAVRRDGEFANGETRQRELRDAQGLRADADNLEDRAEALELLISLNRPADEELDAANLDLASAILILRAFAVGAESLGKNIEEDDEERMIAGAITTVLAAVESGTGLQPVNPAPAPKPLALVTAKTLPLGKLTHLDAAEVRAASHAAHQAGFHAAELEIGGTKLLIIAQPKAPESGPGQSVISQTFSRS